MSERTELSRKAIERALQLPILNVSLAAGSRKVGDLRTAIELLVDQVEGLIRKAQSGKHPQ